MFLEPSFKWKFLKKKQEFSRIFSGLVVVYIRRTRQKLNSFLIKPYSLSNQNGGKAHAGFRDC